MWGRRSPAHSGRLNVRLRATKPCVLTSGGFTFDTPANDYHLLNNDSGVDNGSTYIGIDDFVGPDSTIVSPTGGGPFGLTSIDVSEWHFDPNADRGLRSTALCSLNPPSGDRRGHARPRKP